MNNNDSIQTLIIDSEFQNLLVPLSFKELERLEENIKSNGCLDPLIIWNGIIIDGHNRYKICHKYRIPFRTKTQHFSNRKEAITTICTNQLSKNNISAEMKKYLIGKKYEAEKMLDTIKETEMKQTPPIPSRNDIIISMGKEYNISPNTVYKYSAYSRALDVIQQKCPEITQKILSGNIKISLENIAILSRFTKKKLYNLLEYLSEEPEIHISYSDIRQELQWKPLQKSSPKTVPILQSDIPIKQLPKYDPDAEISSLSLTIPSWISSINRTREITNFDNTTSNARTKLKNQLCSLKNTIDILLVLIKEV